jgi:hypothetical protein
MGKSFYYNIYYGHIALQTPEGYISKDISEAGHILYLRILYHIHIQAQEKDIISFHYHGKKNDMDIYPLSKILLALSQFLNNKKPDLVALQHTSPRLYTGSN